MLGDIGLLLPLVSPSFRESGVGMMQLALRCSHFFPGEKWEGGRGEGEASNRGEGNGLATNCTITTFRKRKNHSVLFLRTICFLLLPPTLQFRGKGERPVLGLTAGGQQARRNTTEARGISGDVGEGLHHHLPAL